jgi:hypothetical protein
VLALKRRLKKFAFTPCLVPAVVLTPGKKLFPAHELYYPHEIMPNDAE